MLHSWIYTRHKCIHLSATKIKPVNPKGIFIERTDAETEAEAPLLWPPEAKSCFVGKDPDVGKDWGKEEKGATEDEMTGWHHQLNGHEFEQIPGDREGQESLACCSLCGHKESDTTERLNWTERMLFSKNFYLHSTFYRINMFLLMEKTENKESLFFIQCLLLFVKEVISFRFQSEST